MATTNTNTDINKIDHTRSMWNRVIGEMHGKADNATDRDEARKIHGIVEQLEKLFDSYYG